MYRLLQGSLSGVANERGEVEDTDLLLIPLGLVSRYDAIVHLSVICWLVDLN